MVDGARCSQIALRTGVATAQTCGKVVLRTGVAKTSSFSDIGGGVRARAAGGAKSGRAPARRGSNAEGGSPCDAGWSTEYAEWWPESQRVALSRRRAAPSGLSEAAESDGGAESPTGGAGRRRVACRRYRCGQPGVEWSSGSAVWVPGEAGTTTAKAAVSAVEARSRESSLQPQKAQQQPRPSGVVDDERRRTAGRRKKDTQQQQHFV